MAGLKEDVEAVALLEAGPGRVVVPPPASGTLSGSGLYSLERATCEPLEPDQAVSIDPDPDLPLLDRLVTAYTTLWKQTTLQSGIDLAATTLIYSATMTSLLNNTSKAEQYLTAVGSSYSKYLESYLLDYVKLLKSAWDSLVKLDGCQSAAVDFTAEAVLGWVAHEELDFDAMKTSLTGDCAVLWGMLDTFAQLYAWDKVLRENTYEVVGAALEVMGEIWVVAVEKLGDTEIIELLRQHASDHIAIGEIHGTLLGVILAEVIIDELLTAGAGKAFRAVRYIRKVP